MYKSTNEIRAFSFQFVSMVIFGSAITLVKKAQNESSAHDKEGNYVPFKHAWLQTTIMSLGECVCIMGFFYFLWSDRKHKSLSGIQTEPFLSYGPSVDVKPRYQHRCFQWSLLPPSAVKVFASGILGVGLIYTKASIWQMLGGSFFIFKMISSNFCYGKRPEPYHYVVFTCTFIGIVFVAAAGVLEGETGDAVFGIVCTLLGQFVLAVWLSMEEKLLKDRNFHPMNVLGMEGFFGLLLMICIVLPVTTALPQYPLGDTNLGRVFHDNVFDGLYMMRNNLNILYFGIVYFFSTTAYSTLRTYIERRMTPIHKALFEPLHMAIIWCVELLIPAVGLAEFGERNTYYSFLEFGGFLLLLTGSLIANKVVRLHHGWYRAKNERVIEVFETPSSELFTPVISTLARNDPLPPILTDAPLERRTDYTLSEAQVVT